MPAADGVDRESGCVTIDAGAHAAGIRADAVDAIGNGFAGFFTGEVMHVDLVRDPIRWPTSESLLSSVAG